MISIAVLLWWDIPITLSTVVFVYYYTVSLGVASRGCPQCPRLALLWRRISPSGSLSNMTTDMLCCTFGRHVELHLWQTFKHFCRPMWWHMSDVKAEKMCHNACALLQMRISNSIGIVDQACLHQGTSFPLQSCIDSCRDSDIWPLYIVMQGLW